MFHTDKFINNIKINPCLWNTKCDEFARRDLKEKAWNEIGGNVHNDWAHLSSEEKQKKVAEMKKKWNNIRDYYRRDNHPDNINFKRRKYVFADLLEFLDPVYDIRGSDCDMPNLTLPAAKDTEDDDYESIEEYTPKKVFKPKAISKKHKIKNKKIPTNVQKKMRNVNIIKQRPTVLASSTTEENPHLSFLKSFIPEMEEMSPYERLDFKAGMISLLRSVKFPFAKEDHNGAMDANHLAVNGSKIRQPSDFLSIRLTSSSAVSPSPSPSLAVSTELISPKTELFTEDFC